MMSKRPLIRRIVYRWGMIKNPSNKQGLKTAVFEGTNLSKEIVDAIFDNDLLSVKNRHGNPNDGEPIEIDLLQIIHDQGIKEITVYNRGIMLFLTDDESIKRIHRVCCVIRKQAELNKQKNSQVSGDNLKNSAQPAVKRKPVTIMKNQDTIYQLKVNLLETNPLVWRRFLVPSSITLHRLHLVLQETMGWTNSHLYRFQIGENEYAEPSPDNEFYELPFKDSKKVKLNKLVTEKGIKFQYEYDFGDSWLHELVVENILDTDSSKTYPLCLGGERACPPEDCGGTSGYAELLEIIRDPKHEQYQDMMTWLGGHFNPGSFDVNAVNKNLHRMRLK